MPCPVCSDPADRFLPYRGIHAREPLLVEAFCGRWVSRCRTCAHVFCDPPPERGLLERYYSSEDLAAEAPRNDLRSRVGRSILGRALLELRARLRLERWTIGVEQLELLERQVPHADRATWLDGEQVLEVGAGSAVFSRTVRARFGRRVSCDVAEPAVTHSAVYRRHRLRVVSPTLDTVPAGSRYRVVHSAHFLEHLTDPNAAFATIRGLLVPDGLVFTEVPNCDAPYWEVFRYPDPPHVHFFTSTSLRALATRSGFEVCSLDTAGERIADEPGLLLPETPEVIDDAEIDRLMAIRKEKLADASQARVGPKENLRMVMRLAGSSPVIRSTHV